MKEPKYCEDCGDEVETRRTRCPNCGKLVCGWCYYHIHGVYSMVASDRIGQPNKACSGLTPESPSESQVVSGASR